MHFGKEDLRFPLPSGACNAYGKGFEHRRGASAPLAALRDVQSDPKMRAEIQGSHVVSASGAGICEGNEAPSATVGMMQMMETPGSQAPGGPLSAGRGRFANRKGRSSFHKKRKQPGESTLERSRFGFIQGPISMHYFLSRLFCCFSQTSLFQRFSWGKKLRIRAAASDSVMPGWFWAMMGVQKSIISCMVQSRVKAPF